MPEGTLDSVRYPFVLYQDELTDGSFCWVAEHPDLEGVHGYGRTQAEALESLSRSRIVYLRGLKRLGIEPAQPTRSFRQAVFEESPATDDDAVGGASGGWKPSGTRKHPVYLGSSETDTLNYV